MGVASTFWAVGLARAASAIGLALALPCLCSLLADIHYETSRGLAFGSFQAASQLGSLLGSLAAVTVADRMLLGMPGWRAALNLVALLSLALGLLLLTTELAAAMRWETGGASGLGAQRGALSCSAMMIKFVIYRTSRYTYEILMRISTCHAHKSALQHRAGSHDEVGRGWGFRAHNGRMVA